MSSHIYESRVGSSYLSFDGGRVLARYTHIARHSIRNKNLARRLFKFVFVILVLLYKINSAITRIENRVSENAVIISAGSFYIILVVMAMLYKYTW